MKLFAELLFVLGAAALLYGCWRASPTAFFIVVGVALLANAVLIGYETKK